MASLNPRLIQALAQMLMTKQRRLDPVTSADVANLPLAKQIDVTDQTHAPVNIPDNTQGVLPENLDDRNYNMLRQLQEGARQKTSLGRKGANTSPQRPSRIRQDTVDEFGRDAEDLPTALRPSKKGGAEDFNAASSLDNRGETPDTSLDRARSSHIGTDKVLNNKQRDIELDLDGQQTQRQMDEVQAIIDEDAGLSALSPALLQETMPDIIANNKVRLGIKDTKELGNSVQDKLRELTTSVKGDDKLTKQIEVMIAKASQAADTNDVQALQDMLDQLTGSDRALMGMTGSTPLTKGKDQFGNIPNNGIDDPTSLPINVPRPAGEPTASMEQIMKAVTQDLGIK